MPHTKQKPLAARLSAVRVATKEIGIVIMSTHVLFGSSCCTSDTWLRQHRHAVDHVFMHSVHDMLCKTPASRRGCCRFNTPLLYVFAYDGFRHVLRHLTKTPIGSKHQLFNHAWDARGAYRYGSSPNFARHRTRIVCILVDGKATVDKPIWVCLCHYAQKMIMFQTVLDSLIVSTSREALGSF